MFKTNEYFEGKVKSIAFKNAQGSFTIGVMDEGEYEFGTSSNEEMTVTTGELEVRLPGEETWKNYTQGQRFNVEANVSFRVMAKGVSVYLCRYY